MHFELFPLVCQYNLYIPIVGTLFSSENHALSATEVFKTSLI